MVARSLHAYSRTPTQTIVPVCGITRSRYLQGSRGTLQRRNARIGLVYLRVPSRTFAFELTRDANRLAAVTAVDIWLPTTTTTTTTTTTIASAYMLENARDAPFTVLHF